MIDFHTVKYDMLNVKKILIDISDSIFLHLYDEYHISNVLYSSIFSEINVFSDEMFSKLKIQKSVTVFSDIIIRNELYKKLIGDLYKY